MRAKHTSFVCCPRCGYDLRGQVDAWHPGFSVRSEDVQPSDGAQLSIRDEDVQAKCPVEGVCSECGLQFWWRNIFRPELVSPGWFVESRKPPRRLWSVVRTLLHVLLPNRFWERVGLEVPIAPTRLTWYCFWTLIFLVIVEVGVLYAIQVQDTRLMRSYFAFSSTTTAPITWKNSVYYTSLKDLITTWSTAIQSMQNMYTWGPAIPSVLLCASAITIMMPVMMLLLPWTRAKAKIRKRHIARAAIYSMAWLSVFLLADIVIGSLEVGFPRTSAARDRLWTYSMSPLCGQRHLTVGLAWNEWLACVWLLWYWWNALKTGFRMEEYRAAFFAGAIPSVILAVLAMLLDIRMAHGLI